MYRNANKHLVLFASILTLNASVFAQYENQADRPADPDRQANAGKQPGAEKKAEGDALRVENGASIQLAYQNADTKLAAQELQVLVTGGDEQTRDLRAYGTLTVYREAKGKSAEILAHIVFGSALPQGGQAWVGGGIQPFTLNAAEQLRIELRNYSGAALQVVAHSAQISGAAILDEKDERQAPAAEKKAEVKSHDQEAAAGRNDVELRMAALGGERPKLGNDRFGIEVTGARPGALMQVWMSSGIAERAMKLDDGQALFLDTDSFFDLLVQGVNPVGKARMNEVGSSWQLFPIPLDPELEGFAFALQATVMRADADDGRVELSNALEMTIARK